MDQWASYMSEYLRKYIFKALGALKRESNELFALSEMTQINNERPWRHTVTLEKYEQNNVEYCNISRCKIYPLAPLQRR